MLLIQFMGAALLAGEPLRVSNAWIPEPPPGARMLAAYFDVENPTPVGIDIVAVESEDFARVEAHRTELESGIARMRKIERVSVGPNESVRFQPGGLHLMLIGPHRVLAAGEEIALDLILEEGTAIRFTARIRRRD